MTYNPWFIVLLRCHKRLHVYITWFGIKKKKSLNMKLLLFLTVVCTLGKFSFNFANILRLTYFSTLKCSCLLVSFISFLFTFITENYRIPVKFSIACWIACFLAFLIIWNIVSIFPNIITIVWNHKAVTAKQTINALCCTRNWRIYVHYWVLKEKLFSSY